MAGLVLTGLGWLSAPWSLEAVKTPDDILADSILYLRIYYLGATGMLACGEDLGMVPDCLPGVMEHEKILSLKMRGYDGPTRTLSVCATSSHDTATLRMSCPTDPSPEAVRALLAEVLAYPSMLAIFAERRAAESGPERADQRTGRPASPLALAAAPGPFRPLLPFCDRSVQFDPPGTAGGERTASIPLFVHKKARICGQATKIAYSNPQKLPDLWTTILIEYDY